MPTTTGLGEGVFGKKIRRGTGGNIRWDRVIRGRVLFLNAHSPVWNSHCRRRKNAKPLEHLIGKFDLLIKNELGRTTRLTSAEFSVIDLALSKIELGP